VPGPGACSRSYSDMGCLSCHGGFVNLSTGRTTSLPVDPVLGQRMRAQSPESKSHKNILRKQLAGLRVA
jgi:hypothetical protein